MYRLFLPYDSLPKPTLKLASCRTPFPRVQNSGEPVICFFRAEFSSMCRLCCCDHNCSFYSPNLKSPGSVRGSFLRTFARIPLQPLSLDPLPDVRRRVLDLYCVRFAFSEKDDRVPVHQGEVLQVQDDPAAVRFGVEQPFQFG